MCGEIRGAGWPAKRSKKAAGDRECSYQTRLKAERARLQLRGAGLWGQKIGSGAVSITLVAPAGREQGRAHEYAFYGQWVVGRNSGKDGHTRQRMIQAGEKCSRLAAQGAGEGCAVPATSTHGSADAHAALAPLAPLALLMAPPEAAVILPFVLRAAAGLAPPLPPRRPCGRGTAVRTARFSRTKTTRPAGREGVGREQGPVVSESEH